jgi:hypothetical protein
MTDSVDMYIDGVHIELAPDQLLRNWIATRIPSITIAQSSKLFNELAKRELTRLEWNVDKEISDYGGRTWVVENRYTFERIICETEARCIEIANMLNGKKD